MHRFFRHLVHAGRGSVESLSVRQASPVSWCVQQIARQVFCCPKIFISSTSSGDKIHGETIFALSSGQGKCGVAVIRVSGPKAREALEQMCSWKSPPPPRAAQLRRLKDPVTKEPIDNGLVLWFPVLGNPCFDWSITSAPESFTGEDCVEFQVHGGPAVIAAMVTSLGKLSKYRHAEPGEFTKRAFMNGKLDLTEVEGLGDLIHAETEIQRRQALRQMEGDLGKLYSNWRSRVMKIVANVEAYIDFSESDTLEEDLLADGQRPAAIVSPIPGTTRDVVETALNVGGYPVLLSDTAGLRETEDIVEKEGVSRAIQRAVQADLKILVLEATYLAQLKQRDSIEDVIASHLNDLGLFSRPPLGAKLSEDVQTITKDSVGQTITKESDVQRQEEMGLNSSEMIVVLNKCDLLSDADLSSMKNFVQEGCGFSVCCVSCTAEQGLDGFLQTLQQRLSLICGNPLSGNPSLTQARYRFHLEKCQGHLEAFKQYMEFGDVVMAAQSLRNVLYDIGKITGRITSEDILDIIFKDFCIGK
ncbi:5-taurinomethyluridine-[tRNA] synthase subunit GTPB3, mitochondrial-like isoform X3 [Crassostrea virginica]